LPFKVDILKFINQVKIDLKPQIIMKKAKKKIDIAIVGGGVSGIYSAWRLKTQYPDKKIVLFEFSDHIGGRLLSISPPDIDNMVAELGGMRIIEETQPIVVNLLKYLDEKYPSKAIETYDFPVDEPQNIAYLRGIYLRLAEFTSDPDKVPYHLSFLEKGGTAGSIIVNAINQIVPGITNKDLNEEQRREMVQNASFDGKPLWEQGFWNVLMRVITGEAYQLGLDAGGYNSTLTNWNAADAIPWYLSDFGLKTTYKGFKKGFQILPITLAELFKEAGGEIRLNHKVDGFEYKTKGSSFEISVNKTLVAAKSLILAMPRRAIDLITPESPLLQEIDHLTSAVTPQPLFKLFTTYADPWWRAAGYQGAEGFVPVESGRSVTDLPVRQTYYWPTNEGKPAENGPSMLMASYDDGSNIGFWDSFRPRRRQAFKDNKEVADVKKPFSSALSLLRKAKDKSAEELRWDKYKADADMVDEVNRQLGIIHGMSYTPPVAYSSFRDWGDDPFGGGWNSWNIGVKSWDVKKKIIQPLKNRKLFICGEAYSDAQGWVEGALDTADMMLEKFGLSPLPEVEGEL
jgi:monoamine oxidase